MINDPQAQSAAMTNQKLEEDSIKLLLASLQQIKVLADKLVESSLQKDEDKDKDNEQQKNSDNSQNNDSSSQQETKNKLEEVRKEIEALNEKLKEAVKSMDQGQSKKGNSNETPSSDKENTGSKEDDKITQMLEQLQRDIKQLKQNQAQQKEDSEEDKETSQNKQQEQQTIPILQALEKNVIQPQSTQEGKDSETQKGFENLTGISSIGQQLKEVFVSVKSYISDGIRNLRGGRSLAEDFEKQRTITAFANEVLDTFGRENEYGDVIAEGNNYTFKRSQDGEVVSISDNKGKRGQIFSLVQGRMTEKLDRNDIKNFAEASKVVQQEKKNQQTKKQTASAGMEQG